MGFEILLVVCVIILVVGVIIYVRTQLENESKDDLDRTALYEKFRVRYNRYPTSEDYRTAKKYNPDCTNMQLLVWMMMVDLDEYNYISNVDISDSTSEYVSSKFDTSPTDVPEKTSTSSNVEVEEIETKPSSSYSTYDSDYSTGDSSSSSYSSSSSSDYSSSSFD